MIAEKDWLEKYIGYEENGIVHSVMILHMYDMCNLHCDCCYARGGIYKAVPSGTFLSDEALENVVKYSSEVGSCMFTGVGEPFLYWDDYTKPKLIPLLKKYGTKCVISTNGLWGNNDKIIDDIIKLEVECISFSIDFQHKVPLENLNHAIERLSDNSVKTRIYMSQITNRDHPIGHVKPIKYEKMVKVEYPIGRNTDSGQGLMFHDANGKMCFEIKRTASHSMQNVFV